MDVVNALLLILAGVIALSGVIAMKRPDLKPRLDALIPFKALIGIGLILCAIVNFAQMAGSLMDAFKLNQIFAAAVWSMLLGSILLGALFAWPIIASAIPDTSPAKPRITEITQNIEMFAILIGAAGIVAAIVYLLFDFHILAMKDGIVDKLF
jgi:xanthine/uracil permease